jgi:hypothetical protein
MPRYFFHLLHPDRAPVLDDEGMTFEDDAVAQSEARASLADLMKECCLSDPAPFHVSVQVVREGVGTINVQTAQVSTNHFSRSNCTNVQNVPDVTQPLGLRKIESG